MDALASESECAMEIWTEYTSLNKNVFDNSILSGDIGIYAFATL